MLGNHVSMKNHRSPSGLDMRVILEKYSSRRAAFSSFTPRAICIRSEEEYYDIRVGMYRVGQKVNLLIVAIICNQLSYM